MKQGTLFQFLHVLSAFAVCFSIIMHAVRRGITPHQRSSSTRSALRDLHWLPVRHRITYKLCVLMHLVHTGSGPSYLSGHSKHSVPEALRSADTNRYEPLTTRLKFIEQCFSHARPKAWNKLSTELQDLQTTVRSDAS